jgi:erythromycin esterase-like protein
MTQLRTLLLVCLLPTVSWQQTAAPAPVNEWIRKSAIPLTTPVAGHGFDDMQALKKVVGDARIVALGEATHGSREFFQLKHRMLEFLATQMGFTIFSIEANMPEAYKLNDYVLHGTGDPVQLIKGMYFWTWDTQEVLAMVQWMREFNQSGKGHVEFTGFDMQTPRVALKIVRDWVAKNDADYGSTLAHAGELALAEVLATQSGFGPAVGSFPVDAALGKTVKFSGYIKTENVTGYAGLWWRADAGMQTVSFENMRGAGPKGTTDWTKYEIELPVPANTTNINFGTLMGGDGTAWFDDLKVELDGKVYESDAFDFTFEGTALKGLLGTVPAYSTRLDREVAHGGKQSLRISHAPVPVNPKAVNPKVAAAEWQKVVDHLSGLPKRDEWALENARVVLQCMQMRGNQVSRDASMAANIKWILDQSPQAKIVLWAHNGHVMINRGSMGAELRTMYGDQMVVFGFAFNQGGFQAMSQGGKGLHDFTVPAAQPGTLDATLAASGIPLFALDLRGTPKTGEVADWLRAAHGTRSIGSMYPEDNPYAFVANLAAPEVYDAVLFVNTTTPARKNGPGVPMLAYKAGTPDESGAAEYRDPDFPVFIRLPKGWSVAQAWRWGERETTMTFQAPQMAGQLYFKLRSNPAKSEEEARELLRAEVDAKTAQRVSSGLTDYKVRDASIQRRTVGGHPALSCIADFTQNGEPMVEYLTWVSGDGAGALFFARVPAEELNALRMRLDPVIESLKLP